MGNMRFKVGDRVRIKSIDWYWNKRPFGELCPDFIAFLPSRSKYCGQIMTIKEVLRNSYNSDLIYYKMIEDDKLNDWTNGMIEGLVEEETKPKHEDEVNGTEEKIWIYQMGQIIHCPDGYIFKDENGNVINATKIVLEKKKKEYPKTYEECCKVLGYDDRETYCICHTGANERFFESLYRLKVCRDAYWKIAGDEMGLGKPWELSIGTPIYYIYYNRTLNTTKKDYADDIHGNVILAFPTEEMRDAFKENFDADIEICKELL